MKYSIIDIKKSKQVLLLKAILIYFFVSIVMIVLLLFVLNYKHIAYTFLLSILILIIVIFPLKEGKIYTAVFLITNFFALFFLVISFDANIYKDLLFFLSTRFAVIFSAMVPLIVLDIRNRKKLIYSSVLAVFISITFDLWHLVNNSLPTGYYKSKILLFNISFMSIFIFLYVLLLIFQFFTVKYEGLILESRKEILKINERLQSNMNYAKNIQEYLLSGKKYLKQYFRDFTLIFKPKEVVSGDFYLIRRMGEKILIIVGDCTGHGVSGAFLTILAISFIENFIAIHNNFSAAEILEFLRERFIDIFSKKRKRKVLSDGMDAAIVLIDRRNRVINYAGAHMPILFISDGNIIKYKATLNYVGYNRIMRDFENIFFEYKSGDMLYMFSDGYYDQLNSEYKKFSFNRFKKVIEEIHSKPFEIQKDIFIEKFNSWRGNMDQVDDVTILGLTL